MMQYELQDELPIARVPTASTRSARAPRQGGAGVALASFSLAAPAARLVATPATPSDDFRRSLYGAPPTPDPARRASPADPIDEQIVHIRFADCASDELATGLLIRKRYGWRGYAVDHGTGETVIGAAASGRDTASQPDRDSRAAPLPGRVTLFAESRGAVIGTMGLCLDGAAGLPADAHFRVQLDALRARGLRLCEPSRLAIDAGMSKRVFASMIHVSYLYAHVLHGYSDYIIEVNPRHVTFYRRMLGFEQAGPVLPCSRVGAPAVLLRLSLASMGQQIRAAGGMYHGAGERPSSHVASAGHHHHKAQRSFYPYFFGVAEETAIIARLRACSGGA